MHFVQFPLDDLRRMLQYGTVSNRHLPLSNGRLTIALTQRNRAQALGATRNCRKREPLNGDRTNIRPWGRREF